MPALLSVKEQYDKDPANKDKAEQVRGTGLTGQESIFFFRGGRWKQDLIFSWPGHCVHIVPEA